MGLLDAQHMLRGLQRSPVPHIPLPRHRERWERVGVQRGPWVSDVAFPCAHTVSTSPFAPTPAPPGSCHLHPPSASSPGSCSLIQLGRCNLLKKKPIIWLITPVGDLARLGRMEWVLRAKGTGLRMPVSPDCTLSRGLPLDSVGSI